MCFLEKLADGLSYGHNRVLGGNIRLRRSHSNSIGNKREKDTAGCCALNRKDIVIGGISVIKKKEETDSLAHTKWNCKYHIVFAPKFRRKIIYGKLRQDIANILSVLCKRKGVKIVEAEMCPDHVHMLVEIPPSISVSSFVGYLKGKSTLMIFA